MECQARSTDAYRSETKLRASLYEPGLCSLFLLGSLLLTRNTTLALTYTGLSRLAAKFQKIKKDKEEKNE
ncbi:MAG: hypothetical protein PVG74_03455 [Desulfobacterales bacterium]|jgi:hypothetical protein